MSNRTHVGCENIIGSYEIKVPQGLMLTYNRPESLNVLPHSLVEFVDCRSVLLSIEPHWPLATQMPHYTVDREK